MPTSHTTRSRQAHISKGVDICLILCSTLLHHQYPLWWTSSCVNAAVTRVQPGAVSINNRCGKAHIGVLHKQADLHR